MPRARQNAFFGGNIAGAKGDLTDPSLRKRRVGIRCIRRAVAFEIMLQQLDDKPFGIAQMAHVADIQELVRRRSLER